ncbi:MAG: Ldh family oxidoreductase, partial [Candidatus Omnitrophica bacterium]|nr:Ldh family oxidoreductase [Candidatus Omnitrophota bacterium]
MEASVEDKKKIILVHYTEIENFILQVLLKNGVDESVAKHVAQGLVQASLRGVDSHGIRLFPHYVRAMKAGRINSKPNFQFDQTSPSTGILDADDTFGHAAGMEAVSKAIELAKSAGSANISVKKSTHFGAAAFYALEIAKHDMIGMSFTHADSLMLSSNGNRPYFGTNPICIAVPCEGEEPFCLDMATTTISFNAVLQHREDKKDVPVGTCADSEGNPTIDSAKASFLQPIGQYKGFGLGMMVEIL